MCPAAHGGPPRRRATSGSKGNSSPVRRARNVCRGTRSRPTPLAGGVRPHPATTGRARAAWGTSGSAAVIAFRGRRVCVAGNLPLPAPSPSTCRCRLSRPRSRARARPHVVTPRTVEDPGPGGAEGARSRRRSRPRAAEGREPWMRWSRRRLCATAASCALPRSVGAWRVNSWVKEATSSTSPCARWSRWSGALTSTKGAGHRDWRRRDRVLPPGFARHVAPDRVAC